MKYINLNFKLKTIGCIKNINKMSSPSFDKNNLFIRTRDIMNTEDKIRRLNSEEPILQLDISKDNRKQIDIIKIIKEKRKEIQKLYINNLGA